MAAEPKLPSPHLRKGAPSLQFGAAAFACRYATGEGWWSRWVTLPHQPACRAGAFLVCHDPILASRPGAAPGRLSFGDSAAQAGALLAEIKRAGSVRAPGPR